MNHDDIAIVGIADHIWVVFHQFVQILSNNRAGKLQTNLATLIGGKAHLCFMLDMHMDPDGAVCQYTVFISSVFVRGF